MHLFIHFFAGTFCTSDVAIGCAGYAVHKGPMHSGATNRLGRNILGPTRMKIQTMKLLKILRSRNTLDAHAHEYFTVAQLNSLIGYISIYRWHSVKSVCSWKPTSGVVFMKPEGWSIEFLQIKKLFC